MKRPDRTELLVFGGELKRYNKKAFVKFRFAIDPKGRLLIHELDRTGFNILDADDPLGEFYFENYQASDRDVNLIWKEWQVREPKLGN